MSHTFTLIVNSGRSGSTYLYHLLKANYSDVAYIAHEDIPVDVSQPRRLNRAYTASRLNQAIGNQQLMRYIDRWQSEARTRPVVETGWTTYHLLPVLSHVFGVKLRYVVLHRDPISVALSRASMGNYHRRTFYHSTSHEVSPLDEFSIAAEKAKLWPEMNHVERCLFWWFVVYREAAEFGEKVPGVPHMWVNAKSIFDGTQLSELLRFCGLDPMQCKKQIAVKNEVSVFARETFPIRDEWKSLSRHTDILRFAEGLGYSYRSDDIEAIGVKYALPNQLLPRIRHAIGYWRFRRTIGWAIRALFARKKHNV